MEQPIRPVATPEREISSSVMAQKMRSSGARTEGEDSGRPSVILSTTGRHTHTLVEYLKKYFAERRDRDTFEAHVNEQMEAYEQAEQEVILHPQTS